MLLLHAGGWDEMAILGAALVVGVGIVLFGGKKKKAQEDAEMPTDDESALISRALDEVRRGSGEAGPERSHETSGLPEHEAERREIDLGGPADRL